ncbi:hypothetical protein GSI_07279 [Ganoderma sinense ZZ0214-1]|uniref:Uncharacterized protein n=1 Tax=Ganoderma sinense ZZ0214-1 TaxID=1077348 RepID=A0A2G8S9Y5_9APHY|nr:hypothetical protein GSI_07279 [Ganoderma sinense ZZ0214-1]
MAEAQPSDMPLSPADIGYSAPRTAGDALHRWYIIHQWALNTVADAFISSRGGIDTLLEPGPRRTLVFTVRAAAEGTENGGNPAKMFKLVNINIVKSEEHYAIAKRSEYMQQRCDNMNADLRGRGIFYVDRTFAGMFCAAFIVAGTGVVNHERIALHRLPLRHVPADLNDSRTRRVLAQSVQFLNTVITSGAVLRYRDSDPREEPERGHYVRTRRSWRFQPLQDDQWESLVLSANRNGATLPSTELTTSEMLTLFDARGSFLTLRNLGG